MIIAGKIIFFNGFIYFTKTCVLSESDKASDERISEQKEHNNTVSFILKFKKEFFSPLNKN